MVAALSTVGMLPVAQAAAVPGYYVTACTVANPTLAWPVGEAEPTTSATFTSAGGLFYGKIRAAVLIESGANTASQVVYYDPTSTIKPSDYPYGAAGDPLRLTWYRMNDTDDRIGDPLCTLGVNAPPLAPNVPVISGATAGVNQATISVGPGPGIGDPPTSFLVTASPGGGTCTITLPETSCTITGLAGGTAYSFTATATNEAGTSGPSSASAAVTPTAPAPSPSGGGSSTAEQRPNPARGNDFGVNIPNALARAGLPVSAGGTVALPLACPAGIPGGCDASGVLSTTIPSVQLAKGRQGEQASRTKVLARFKGVQIASGKRRLYSVRLAPTTYVALRRAGVRRVPATLRIVNRLESGTPVTTNERVWLRIRPLGVPVAG